MQSAEAKLQPDQHEADARRELELLDQCGLGSTCGSPDTESRESKSYQRRQERERRHRNINGENRSGIEFRGRAEDRGELFVLC